MNTQKPFLILAGIAALGAVTFAALAQGGLGNRLLAVRAQNRPASLESGRTAHGLAALTNLQTARTTSVVTFFDKDGKAWTKNKNVLTYDFTNHTFRTDSYSGKRLASVVLITPTEVKLWHLGGSVRTLNDEQAASMRKAPMLGVFGLRTDATEVVSAAESTEVALNENAGTDNSVTSEMETGVAPTANTPSTGAPTPAASQAASSEDSTVLTQQDAKGAVASSEVTVAGTSVKMNMSNGEETSYSFNPKTGLIATQRIKAPTGDEQVLEFSNYKKIKGLKLPFRSRVMVAGKVLASERVVKVELNPNLKAADFALPK